MDEESHQLFFMWEERLSWTCDYHMISCSKASLGWMVEAPPWAQERILWLILIQGSSPIQDDRSSCIFVGTKMLCLPMSPSLDSSTFDCVFQCFPLPRFAEHMQKIFITVYWRCWFRLHYFRLTNTHPSWPNDIAGVRVERQGNSIKIKWSSTG